MAAEPLPLELESVGISENIGVAPPVWQIFTNEEGFTKPLSGFIDPSKPTILSFVYFNCPMICDLVLMGLSDSLSKLPDNFLKGMNIVTISFDPKDKPAQALAFKKRYIEKTGKPGLAENWHFLTGDYQSIAKLSRAVGYHYKYQTDIGEYAHPSTLIIMNDKLKINRYIYGIEYNPFTLRLALLDSKEKSKQSAIEQALLFCYNYDPGRNSYVLHAYTVMRLGAALTVFLLLGLIITLTIKTKRTRK